MQPTTRVFFLAIVQKKRDSLFNERGFCYETGHILLKTKKNPWCIFKFKIKFGYYCWLPWAPPSDWAPLFSSYGLPWLHPQSNYGNTHPLDTENQRLKATNSPCLIQFVYRSTQHSNSASSPTVN